MFGFRTINGSELVLIHFIVARLNIQDEELVRMLRLDRVTDLPLVDLFPTADDLFAGKAWMWHVPSLLSAEFTVAREGRPGSGGPSCLPKHTTPRDQRQTAGSAHDTSLYKM